MIKFYRKVGCGGDVMVYLIELQLQFSQTVRSLAKAFCDIFSKGALIQFEQTIIDYFVGSPGQVVMGDDSCLRGREFEAF